MGPQLSELSLALAPPQYFDGNCQKLWGFLNQCCLLFLLHPRAYPTNQAGVGLAISLLTGEALDGASPLLERGSLVLTDWNAFLQTFSAV
uniref:DUF4939 domain-containing protein n=1 Tax=Gopherus evgoodei TaxID=1825980 RepID=A0A8C4WBS1_9SAUR